MGPSILVDTNAVIELVNGGLPPASVAWLEQRIGDDAHHISMITRIELFSKLISSNMTEVLTGFVRLTDVIGLDEAIIQQTMRLRQQRRLKLPDAVIAATALARGLVLVTRNVGDFAGLPGLAVLNLHDTGQLPVL